MELAKIDGQRKKVQAMGFFTDIIGDSQRPVGRNARAASLRVTPGAESMASSDTDPKRHLVLRNDSLNQIETSEKTFWEEDFRQSGATRVEAQSPRLENRQVVGPSLSENTDNSDLSKAPEQKSSFPDIEKQKQAGLKNRRAVTVQMNRDRNLHSSVSFGRGKSSSKDSSVVESGSKHPEQSARGKSVEVTHRSRQAGQTTRAGTATPPDSSRDVLATSSPDHITREPTGKTPFPTEDRELLKVRTPAEMILSPTERQRPQVARQETSALAASSHAEEEGNSRMRPVFSSAETEGMVEDQNFEPPVSKIWANPTVTGDAPVVLTPVEVNFHDQPSLESTRDSRLREPRPEAVGPKPVGEPSGPKVHIGLLEIVVLAAEKQMNRGVSPPPEGQNFASRHYLRNF
jgi:hypothetical protein